MPVTESDYHNGQAAMVARLCRLTLESAGTDPDGATRYRFTGHGVDVAATAHGHGYWSATTGGVGVPDVDGIHSLKLALSGMVAR